MARKDEKGCRGYKGNDRRVSAKKEVYRIVGGEVEGGSVAADSGKIGRAEKKGKK